MPRRLLALIGLAISLAVGGLAAGARAGMPGAASVGTLPTGATVIVGTGGLSWGDVSEKATPNLWALLRNGSGGSLSIRSIHTNTCPIDGWLGLSAGARAGVSRGGSAVQTPCADLPTPPTPSADPTTLDLPAPITVPGWAAYLADAKATKFDATLGTLGDSAAKGGQCIRAVGPGAALAAARSDGTVDHWTAFDPSTVLEQVNACPLSIVDVGSLRDDVAPGETRPTASRAEQITAIDTRIGEVVAAAPGGADVVVASLADAGMAERLRLVVAKGPHFGPGEIDSPSTKQPGLAQAQDLTVTALSLQGLQVPDALGGAPLSFAEADGNSDALAALRLQHLVDYDQASHEVHALVPPFFNAFAYGQLVAYLLVLLVWRGKIGSEDSRLRTLGWVRTLAVGAASVPAATFLANLLPWWRFSIPMLSVVASVGFFVVLIAGLALIGPWGRTTWGPMLVVSGLTMGVLAADIMTGSRLQLSSLMGLQPVVAGRFYGMGNVTFAIFVTAALLLATALSSLIVRAGSTRLAAIVAALVGAFAVLVDGAPFWGADGGGPPAAIPGFAFLVLSILGVAMTWKRIMAIGLACVALFFAVGFLDWLRPAASRTHLGRFIQAIIDGGAWDIVVRKGQQNLSILLGNAPLTLLVPAALLFVAYVLARPTSWGARALQRSFTNLPTLRAGLIALVITLTIGFLINDSGTAIPAVGATVAVPLIVSVVVRTLAEQARTSAPTRRERLRA
ncbi:MAG TPA: hypothetical protein PLZ92_14060 [Phycicoccus sp.]|nr:hypothetical protein [Phycicoccus sp.]